MSWSVSGIGTKDFVRQSVEQQFDGCAKNYEGNDEQKDILAAKERALSVIDTLALAPDAENPAEYGVRVSCYGSRSTDGNGLASVSMTVNVERYKTGT